LASDGWGGAIEFVLDSMVTFLGFGWRWNPKFTEEGHSFQPSRDFKKSLM
jgi:hypothetical protein